MGFSLKKLKAVDLAKVNRRLEDNFWIISFLLISFFIFFIFKPGFWVVLPFYVAFYWNWLLTSVEIRRKAHRRKYAFSFIRFVLVLNKVIEKTLPHSWRGKKALTRSLSPLFFFLLVFIAVKTFLLFYSLLGSLFFELARKVNEVMRESYSH